ncbi:HU domain-containing protein [Aureispira anguillae]|uniref:SPOR domain-containing protein n=1 Tax=Aureispira anguillae TaxID=2864201 RepID=A0A915YEP9_9BACT|nr:SPOR domain-containing protein [Aureispira anguillae]BDS11626.1 SPOR domain-containing protein [Aureispira anguillae]
MDLSHHIEELLYSNDCVIIPTIGGFIVNYTASSIDFVEQRLLPPQKSVSFNAKLVNNDGLLANHIAQKEHLTYKQATSKVEEFSRQIEIDLFNNKIVHFNKIGKLYFNSDSKLEFVPFNTNFLKDAYGLPDIPCVPILRSKDYLIKNKSEEKAVAIQSKGKPAALITALVAKPRVIAAVAAIFLFALASPYIYNALFHSAPTETSIAQDKDTTTTAPNKKSQASLIPSISATNSSDTVATEQDSTPIQEQEVPEIPQVDPSQDYVIVLGAFGKKRNARRLAKKLEKDNYLPDVTYKNGLNRVGVQITCSPEELKQHLKFLQENYNKKAWVVE